MSTPRVVGIDACRRGWVGILLADSGPTGHFAKSISALVEEVAAGGPLDVVAVDMPLGLADDGPRAADELARKRLGALGSSVFLTPVRPALEAASRAEADVINRQLSGRGVSAQAFALKVKFKEVETWARAYPGKVVEVHPEVSFTELMVDEDQIPAKRSWAGMWQRSRALAKHGIQLPEDLGIAGVMAATDDVLDAAAAAWSARRVATGSATPLPDPPIVHTDGWPCAIWV